MTGYASLNSAIAALRLGASDYLIKPCSKKHILSSIKNALINKRITNNELAGFDPKNLKIKSGQKPLPKKEIDGKYSFYFQVT